MEDVHLIKGIKKRDQRSLEKLMDKYLNYVFTIANNILGDFLENEDIEEVCIDVFISLWNNADKIDSSYKELKPYIAAIARNTARNKFKTAGDFTESLDDQINLMDSLKIEEKILQIELSQLLKSLISELDEPDREIVIRYYFFYEKVKNIANRLNLNENTVKTKLSRSRERLKIMIEERRFYNED